MKKSLLLTLVGAAFALACGLAPVASSQAAETAPGQPTGRPARPDTIKTVGVDAFDQLRQQTNHVILDVRTPKEFAAGHIKEAVNLDLYANDFEKKISALDRNKTYLVHCAAGARSLKACQMMDHLRFPNLINLDGGIKAWEKAGKPIEK